MQQAANGCGLRNGRNDGMVAQRKLPSRERLSYRLRQYWPAYILLLPVLAWYIIFCYAPMGGLVIAFKKYSVLAGIGASPWIGLKNFEKLFTSQAFYQAIKNTLILSGLNFVFGFPLPISFAILLNEMPGVKYKKVVQTVSYLPHFISWVVCATLMFDLMSTDGGAINEFLMWIGFTKEPIGFFTEGKYFWGITLFTDIWKELGWNAIIFISAITSISQDMYEAADVDGATRMQKILHITLPALKPTIMILLILAIGGVLNTGYEQQLLMSNDAILNYSDVLDTYAYRYGLKNGMYSYGTAVGFFKSAVSFILVISANALSKKFSDDNTALF